MKIKHKKTGEIGESSSFNTMALCEIFVYFDDWMDTDFPSAYLFQLRNGEWVDFWDERIIPNNHNTSFRETKNDEELTRGYF